MFLVSCNNPELGSILFLINNILNIVIIIGPILAIISLTIHFINLMRNPDDKKTPKKIKNSILALVFLFFVPTIVNAFMYMLDDSNEFSACWVQSKKPNYNSSYLKPSGKKKSSIINESSQYEKGGNNSNSNSSIGNSDSSVPSLGNIIAIDNKHYNYAVINTKLVGNITWKSANHNIATVNNGVVVARENADGETVVTASNGTENEQYRVVVIAQRSANFKRDDNDYSNEIKESYINNAEILCHSQDLSKFSECSSVTFPIYTGDYSSAVKFAKTVNRRDMTKDVGISATNYLIFVSSKKQTLTLLEKVNGEWKVKYSFISSTGRDFSVKGDYSFAFYAGVVEYDSNPAVKKCGSNAINQFRQGKKKGGLRIKEANIKESAISGRWIHYSSALGYPSSAGCNHLSCNDYQVIRDIIKDNLGTRIIVF